MRRVIKIGRNPRTNFQPSKSENWFDLIIYEVPTFLKADTADYLMRKTWTRTEAFAYSFFFFYIVIFSCILLYV